MMDDWNSGAKGWIKFWISIILWIVLFAVILAIEILMFARLLEMVSK